MSKRLSPKKIWDEYERGRNYKSAIGERGMYEQNRRNERFFVGDQWHGAKCGERPLVRHNVIKRIGDYKISVVTSAPVSASFSAEGVPNTHDIKHGVDEAREYIASAAVAPDVDEDENVKINLVMQALSAYFKTTAERVKLDDLKEQVLSDAYIGGTGYLYTYWDPTIRTGLYADEWRQTAIIGDIACEALDVENVYMGDPNNPDIQSQPYILVVQRKCVKELRNIAKANRIPSDMIDAIRPDSADASYTVGDVSRAEPHDSKKATVITRFWKATDKQGNTTVKAIQCCHDVIIRREWDTKIRLYPFASFTWQKRKNCAYGDSEVTYLIPNQIAINRMLTASVWAVMMLGIPITVVNGDVVESPITNDPGQVVRVFGDPGQAIAYVNPPQFSPSFDNNINSLIANTLTQTGANDAALGNLRPDNMSAIIAVREAATAPMQPVQNRFYSFIEDVARIWAEFWVMKYGARSLKIEDDRGVWYMPFNGDDFKDTIITARIDVGAAGIWSESQSVATLDNLFGAQIITPLQYLQRLPKGVVPDLQGLISELQKSQEAVQQQASTPQPKAALQGEGIVDSLPPEYKEMLAKMPTEQAEALVNKAISAGPALT